MIENKRYYSEKKISSSKSMGTFQKAMGISMMIIGGLMLFGYMANPSDYNLVDLLLYFVIAVGGVILFILGRKKKQLIHNFSEYMQYLKVQETVEISDLSTKMGKSQEIILRELGELLKEQFFVNMIIDYSENQIQMIEKDLAETIDNCQTEVQKKEDTLLSESKEDESTMEEAGVLEESISGLKEADEEKSKSEFVKKIGRFVSGYRNFKELTLLSKVLHIGVPIVCLILLFVIFGGSNQGSEKDYIDCAKTAVSRQLRSPSTAIYYGEEILDEDEYGRVLVKLCVEAQNGFGGYVKNTFLIVISDYNNRTEEFIHGQIINYDVSEEWLEDSYIEQAKSVSNWDEPLSEKERL